MLVTQASALANELPHYLHILNNHNTTLGKLNARFHIVASLQRLVNGGASSALAGGVLGVGKAILNRRSPRPSSSLTVSIYLLADLPRVKRGIYQLAPRTPASTDGAAHRRDPQPRRRLCAGQPG